MKEENWKSEETEKKESSVPITNPGIGTRIDEVAKKVGGKKRLSQITSISESHLYRLINGKSEPAARGLVAIADAGDVSVQWLVTGDTSESWKSGQSASNELSGPISGGQFEAGRADRAILEPILRMIRLAEAEKGVHLSSVAFARLASGLYDFAAQNPQIGLNQAAVNGFVEEQAKEDKWDD